MRKEAERVHETALSASETQFEHAKRWRRVDRLIGAIAAFLAAIAGVGGLSQIISARWAGLVAIMAAGVGAVGASLGASQTKEKAGVSANAYRTLQQDARIFINIDLPSLTKEEASKRLQRLVETQQQLNREADIPSAKAWSSAKENLAGGAQEFKADE
jgi:hypothetical protein